MLGTDAVCAVSNNEIRIFLIIMLLSMLWMFVFVLALVSEKSENKENTKW